MATYPAGTCEACKTISLHALLATNENSHEENERLSVRYRRVKGAAVNCPLCRVIFASIHRGDEIEGDVRVMMTVDDKGSGDDIYESREVREVLIRKCRGGNAHIAGSGRFRVYADEGSVTARDPCRSLLRHSRFVGSFAADVVANRRAPSSNLSEQSLDQLQRWIVDCDLTHKPCHTRLSGSAVEIEPELPTRVINVGANDDEVRVVVSGGRSGRYIALSHCWGLTRQAKLTMETQESFAKQVPVHSLSNTFRDALKTTRLLGITYLWIDSLCIVQDDNEDWLRESAKMGSIYESAYITLAATSAVDGSGGLQGCRSDSVEWIRFPCDGADASQGYMWFTDADWTAQSDLDQSPLNQRGWVFQERLLSRRIVHFAASQVYWECQESFANEEGGKRLHFAGTSLDRAQWKKNIASLGHLGLMPGRRCRSSYDDNDNRTSLGSFHAIWMTYVHHYCARKLTRSEDRLVALFGLAKLVAERIGLRFIDGHWDDGSWSFVRSLAWLAESGREVPSDGSGRRKLRCSSWSWAALDGPIDYEFARSMLGQYVRPRDCKLQLIEIEQETEEYAWTCRPLRFSGTMRRLRKGALNTESVPRNKKKFVVSREDDSRPQGLVYFDMEADEPQTLFFCPLGVWGDNARCVTCLALVEYAVASPDCFRRVGVGQIQDTAGAESGESIALKLFEACQPFTFRLI
jgi:hypothetical protein